MSAAARRTLGAALVVAGLVMLVLPGPGLLCLYAGLSLAAPGLTRRLRARLAGRLFERPLLTIDGWKKRGVSAGCTTRPRSPHLPGVSALDSPDTRKQIEGILAGPAAPGSGYAYLHQVHGARVERLWADRTACRPGEWVKLPETDGAVTDVPGLTILVLTADCLSVFVSIEDRGRVRAAGLVHAGWRGTRLGIVPEAVRALCERTGLGPARVRAVLGPHIGGCHYEVGEEFGGYFPASSLDRRRGRLYLDLARETTRQLAGCGVRRTRVSDLGICTAEETRYFHSVRVDGERAGRTVSFLQIR